MVYVDPGDLKWKPYVRTWLDFKFSAKISDEIKVYLQANYTCTVEPLIVDTSEISNIDTCFCQNYP